MNSIRVVLAVLAISFVGVPTAGAAPVADPDTVQVFFSRDPDSFADFTAVFPLSREVAGGPGIIDGVVAALLAGPTAAEQSAGYFSDFQRLMGGTLSTCKGGFTTTERQGIITVQLCRATSSAGVGQDARAQAEIEATLMQLPGITRIIVLNTDGHCLLDQSGLDLCLLP
jgi:hypothetical protein